MQVEPFGKEVAGMNLAQRIQTALGERLPALVLKGGTVVNVFTGELVPGDVAIDGGRIVGVGDYDGAVQVDVRGRYIAPGFLNAHCHVESSMVLPGAYCREELRHGVTTLITDPHEIANVAGAEGIAYMLAATEDLPVRYYVQVPSCVPATPFEHAGAVLEAADLLPFRDHPRVLGLGEMMNYPGVAGCDPAVLDKLEAFTGKTLDGHAPSITGRGLQAYAAAGISTDHESVTWAEAKEKLRAGIAVLVREGSASRNLTDLLTGALADGTDTRNLAFCTDDKHLADLRREGSIRHNAARAVALGMDPVTAIQLATLNAARIYGLRDLGAVAPGYRADLVVLDNLNAMSVVQVYQDGVLRVDRGQVLDWPAEAPVPAALLDSVHLPPLTAAGLALPERESYPVAELVPGQIVTRRVDLSPAQVRDGLTDGTLRKLVVVERHHASGHLGVGLLRGYGLTRGAVGTTVAHDSHNLILVGDNDSDLLLAARTLQEVHGGYCLVRDGQVEGVLPLAAAGLMSTAPTEEFLPALEAMLAKARAMGVAEGVDPFTTLSFLALPVIPSLRVTDLGVFDVEQFRFV